MYFRLLKWVMLPLYALLLIMSLPLSVQAAGLPVLKGAVSCDSLTGVDLTAIGGPGSKISSASLTTINNAGWCQVDGTLAPEIGFRVMLPTQGWNQRYMQIGCGGLCGQITLRPGATAGCAPLNNNGFAVAATDMGHKASEQEWGNDKQKREDFAWRAQHLTAVTAKTLIAAFYQKPAAFAYFNGCSDGGREALMEAQRFPLDFNGIIAGAAAMNFQLQNALYHSWQVISNRDAAGHTLITASDLPLIHKAVVEQCDTLDGQKDGLIAVPEACHPNLSVLACKKGQRDSCLNAEQLSALRKLYDGPRDTNSGQKLIVGGPQYGSELAWEGVFIPQKAGGKIMSQEIALGTLRYLNFRDNPNPSFELNDVQFTLQTLRRLSELHPLYDATNPDLRAFQQAGGKLIIWHGWADQHISPLNSIAYHNAIGQIMGEQQRQTFERLYLLPGMYHCSDGEGPSLVDFLTPIMDWVENGQAPDEIITWQAKQQRSSFGQPVSTDKKQGQGTTQNDLSPDHIPKGAASRPIFPYPDYAVWDGRGDEKQAESYVRKPLPVIHHRYTWAGEKFYTPYYFIQ